MSSISVVQKRAYTSSSHSWGSWRSVSGVDYIIDSRSVEPSRYYGVCYKGNVSYDGAVNSVTINFSAYVTGYALALNDVTFRARLYTSDPTGYDLANLPSAVAESTFFCSQVRSTADPFSVTMSATLTSQTPIYVVLTAEAAYGTNYFINCNGSSVSLSTSGGGGTNYYSWQWVTATDGFSKVGVRGWTGYTYYDFPHSEGIYSSDNYDDKTFNCLLEPGYTFEKWIGVLSPTSSLEFYTNEATARLYISLPNVIFYAYAIRDSYTMSLTAGSNVASVSADAAKYYYGDTCTVTATLSSAPAGYEVQFTGWYENGELVSTDLSYTFTVTGNRSLTAVAAVVPRGGIDIYDGDQWNLYLPYIYHNNQWQYAIPYIRDSGSWEIGT